MTSRQKVAISLLIPVLCASGWLTNPTVAAQSNTTMTMHPAALIDARAREMRADNDASVRKVVDEIFNYPHVMGRMPAPVESALKDRLARSEIGFLHGTRSGVREEDVVTLFDTIAGRLNLPDYVRTSKKQVRTLRMSMALASPVFMGRGLTDPKMNVGDSIGSEMSVLQAAHLAAVLMDQKFLDPDYQLPPDQWDRESHEREVQRIKEREEMLKAATNTQHQVMVRSNPKRMELHQAISKRAASFSVQDSLDLLETTLRILKVDR